ncbi:MAG: HDOD domain-containing protein [Calditrichia bacterium]
MSNTRLSPEYVENKVRSLARLATLPNIAVKVMELVENPKTSASTLAHFISVDQVLAARILKLANSAYYGFPKEISTLNLAIVVLGFNALRDLVLSISVIDRFSMHEYDENFEVEQFWRHALIVGRGARVLAKFLNYPVTGEVFVAGLLHDIGYPVMLQNFPEDFMCAAEYANNHGISFHESENNVLDFTHTQLGGWLAEGWNLPDKLVRAIRYHHAPEKNHSYQDLVNIIHMADLISYTIGEGSGIKNNSQLPEGEIDERMKMYLPRNGYPLSFYQEKFSQEGEKIDEFLDILKKRELVG